MFASKKSLERAVKIKILLSNGTMLKGEIPMTFHRGIDLQSCGLLHRVVTHNFFMFISLLLSFLTVFKPLKNVLTLFEPI